MAAVLILPIHDMDQRHAGLTKAVADSYTEAAEVCLDRHHGPPEAFDLKKGDARLTATLKWQSPDERTRSAWANDNDATEAGAYACVLAAVELLDGLVAVRRAETMTGADYYIAPRDDAPNDLENSLRLEVSGVDRGPESKLTGRLRVKLNQAAAGKSNLPALAGVVGFKARLILLADLGPS